VTSPAGYRESPLYSVFTVGRVLVVELQAAIRERGAPGYIDLSASKWEIRLRFAPYPLVFPVAFDRDYVMTKLTGTALAGDTGLCKASVLLPTAREQLHVEWVAVETDVDDGDDPKTPSGKREHALSLPWIARAVAMGTPA
jgi:hypothetical protein